MTDRGGLGAPTNADPAAMERIVENTTERTLAALRRGIDDGE